MHLFEYLFLFWFHDGRIFWINVVIAKQMKHTVHNQKCKFPHVVARFVDYMVGDPEISVTSNWGAIGYNYEKDEDGVLR